MTWELNNINMKNINIYAEKAMDLSIWYAPKIVWAILTIWIWFKVVNILIKAMNKTIEAKKIDPTIERFIDSLVSNILKALIIIAAIWILWVQTTSFVAMFAAVGLAIGMALSWTLWNFASGIMILLFKPYKVWDLIDTAGHLWTVKEVAIFNTILTTLDAKTIIIPNSQAIWWSITNYSMENKKRVDIDVWISYWDSIDKAREVMQQIADKEKRVIHKDWVTIAVKELWDNAVIFTFRTWVKTKDYWEVYFWLTEAVKKEFDKKWLNFPFPQRDVHIYNEK